MYIYIYISLSLSLYRSLSRFLGLRQPCCRPWEIDPARVGRRRRLHEMVGFRTAGVSQRSTSGLNTSCDLSWGSGKGPHRKGFLLGWGS